MEKLHNPSPQIQSNLLTQKPVLKSPLNDGPPGKSKSEALLKGRPDIGGPSSPEATSFAAVGSDKLVNLFTGDFSYSVPLLDVGGYPVNLFYNAGITMDQEASWVGLGWNINPGSVSRNMRGIPDDFNGEDMLKVTQKLKPNRTWGGEIGGDFEYLGIKKPSITFGGSLGFSYNNYLGPALEIGAKVGLSIPILENLKYEKSATDSLNLNLSVNVGAKLSSRSGLTFSPSLNANVALNAAKVNAGIGLTTSYNSRTGIKDLTLYSQVSYYQYQDTKKGKLNPDNSFTSSLNLGSTSFTFAKPSYLPSLRMPMENSNFSGQLEFGLGNWGVRGSLSGSGYYSESRVPAASEIIFKPLVGFMYSENANSNKDAVMDFTRSNDGEVTPHTPVISAPQYAYDIFSIQGEGTGGSIRAYRGDLGFMRDNVTTSRDKNISIGADIAPPGHFGGNWNIISAPTRVGGWEDNNNTLLQTISFRPAMKSTSFENYYFKNPGEASVTNEDMIHRIGDDNLVRFQLTGSSVTPRLESQLEQFNKTTGSARGIIPLSNRSNNLNFRDKRTQVTTMLNAGDASLVGLEKEIRNYDGTFNTDHTIHFQDIPRVDDVRKAHHISEIDVLEQNGMRYVYGLPVYNIVQKDFTFSVREIGNPANNLVNFSSDEPGTGSLNMDNNSKIDGYLEIQETPAYASSFLLTALISPDYVDVTGNGITEDDLGSAVKFDYTKSFQNHNWRTPRDNTDYSAHFNEGLKTETRDNKATISYGERESWYLYAIESKSMIAIFKTDNREDAKGVAIEADITGTTNTTENSNKKLVSIDLYTKAEIKAKGIDNARPLKTVHFVYDYSLCNGTPDNINGEGKLTLKSIYFTYNGQSRGNKNQYVFKYGDNETGSDNPSYQNVASDRWGTYKQPSQNPSVLNNIEYPYTSDDKASNDQYAASWSLKKILLPSGGQLEIQYEADDYAYVQNRRACNMYNIYGLGKTQNYTEDNSLYTSGNSKEDNNYIYIQLPQAIENTDPALAKQEIYRKYLENIKQLAFKLRINMPKGVEPLTVFAEISDEDSYGICPNSTGNDIIYIKLKQVEGKSPLARSAIQFITENLTSQAFPGNDIEVTGIPAFLDMVTNMLHSIKDVFKSADAQMRSAGRAKTIVLDHSYVRLDNPYRIKYGGGLRVKEVLLRDNWDRMTGQYQSTYGQDYDYTKTENINGIQTTISSGVASYEPGIGSEENPFREILSYNNKLPLASAQYGAIEMPVLEGLYPSPNVGYSQVSVRSIHRKGTHNDSTLRSAVGKQVTKFYTAKDYPSYSSFTPMSVMEYNKKPFLSLLYKEIINRKTISQGFLVETNDMHGKMKSQEAFSESDENTPLSGSYYSYKNTGKNGMDDKVRFVYNDEGGNVKEGNMGVDAELMTDVREFRLQSNGFNGQAQIDFLTYVPWPFFLTPIYGIETYQENLYRAVTCTKLINYHAIEDSIIVMDKGSVVSTKTIAYDAETGTPVVTRTANEFNDPVYNVSYPAYWAYSSTGLAYKNIGIEYPDVSFLDGRIQGVSDMNIFESGDELYLLDPGTGTPGCNNPTYDVTKLWAFDQNKNNTALTVPAKDFMFMDSVGKFYTKNHVHFKIIRSGKRNNLGLTLGSVTCMQNPIRDDKLVVDNTSNVVSASAVEYKEKWLTDNDLIVRKTYTIDPCTSTESETPDCNGILEKSINPYMKGLIGNLKPYRSYTYYGSRNESDMSNSTAIRKNGYVSNFGNYWLFNTVYNMVPDYANQKWVWNSEMTKVNAKGAELETKDALQRYTTAQYGFNKNFPVAITQNARYGEGFNEGFEDYNYDETINSTQNNTCDNRYMNLKGLPNSSIVNTDGMNIKAHSGRYALQVEPGQKATKILNIAPIENVDYNFNLETETTKQLIDPGGNVDNATVDPFNIYDNNPMYTTPQSLWEGITQFSNGGFNVPGVVIRDAFPNDNLERYHYFNIANSYYIQVLSSGTYYFTLKYAKNEYCNLTALSLQVAIENVAGGNGTYVTLTNNSTYTDNNVFLCKGIYKITSTISNYLALSLISNPINLPNIYHSSFPSAEPDGCTSSSTLNYWGWYCPFGFPDGNNNSWGYPGISLSTNAAAVNWRSLTEVGGCTSTKPIPATDTMLNPGFTINPGERMQFSAWVREACDSLVCYKPAYLNNHVVLQFNGSTPNTFNFYPSGNIIDGWQKIEGEFTVPSDATSAVMLLSNDGGQDVYFDDIRIHPFNANMKTYVYDPTSLRLSAELDENNYASFYDYDEEGQLVRVKKETIQGIKTIKETRNAKQKSITDFESTVPL